LKFGSRLSAWVEMLFKSRRETNISNILTIFIVINAIMHIMKVFLGVTSQKEILNIKVGEKSFWCVNGNHNAQEKDLLLMYKSVYGIAQIYEITSKSFTEGGHFMCSMRDMLTINTVLLENLPNPITATDLKADPILSKWSPVRRNFQQTTFTLTEDEWEALKKILITKNPSIKIE
jgi:hypothetical protein